MLQGGAQNIEGRRPFTPPSIPFVDLSIHNHTILSEWMPLARDLINTSSFIKGLHVDQFESRFAAYNNARHCIGVASGTDALVLALKACDIGAGDEVITVSHSFVATAEAIALVGAKPVFVDITDRHYTMAIDQLRSAITAKTKAILPVHLYGQCVDMDPLLEIAAAHNLFVIEDACQAHGALYKNRRAGSIGDLGCFSFYPTKNLGAFGDGGAVITNNAVFADKMRHLADHGQSSQYCHQHLGTNSRLDNLQAAALRLKLKHLDAWNDERFSLAELYNRLLADIVQTPAIADDNTHVYHLYVIATDLRDLLQTFLKQKGISTMIHYPVPIHAQVAFRPFLSSDGGPRLPNTEAAAGRILSLPLYPGLKPSDVHRICQSIHSFFKAHR